MAFLQYFFLLWVIFLPLSGQTADSSDEQAVKTVQTGRCSDFSPDRQLFFGDLHVHTRYSLDASTQNTRTSPQQAYAFAKGEQIGIQPWNADGSPQRKIQLSQALDFAAITDHAELLGEVHICQTPSEEGYNSRQCRLYRAWPRAAFFAFNTKAALAGRLGFCGEEVQYCL